jgi:hypothetical protein
VIIRLPSGKEVGMGKAVYDATPLDMRPAGEVVRTVLLDTPAT